MQDLRGGVVWIELETTVLLNEKPCGLMEPWGYSVGVKALLV